MLNIKFLNLEIEFFEKKRLLVQKKCKKKPNKKIFQVNKIGDIKNIKLNFKSHTGRMSVTCVAMMATDEAGNQKIPTDKLEHNQRWERNTKVLQQYMASHVSWCKNGFMRKMAEIRDEKEDEKIDEEAVGALNLRKFPDSKKFTDFLEDLGILGENQKRLQQVRINPYKLNNDKNGLVVQDKYEKWIRKLD